jgi:arylsulfatase A-like enzyme
MFGKVSIDPEERRRLWLSYLGEARYLDSVVKRLVELIASTADMIILTSDHGEHFGEHELWWHGWGCYEELVHVPLVILGKDIPAMKRTDPVSHLDVHRTVLNAAGVEASSHGHDLTTDYRGDRGYLIESSGVYKYDAEAIRRTWGEERLTEWDTPQTAFVKGRRKLIIDRDGARVYDLKRDPQEQMPLKGKLLNEMIQAMKAEQQSLKLYIPQGELIEAELPLEVVKRLEDLGYL